MLPRGYCFRFRDTWIKRPYACHHEVRQARPFRYPLFIDFILLVERISCHALCWLVGTTSTNAIVLGQLFAF